LQCAIRPVLSSSDESVPQSQPNTSNLKSQNSSEDGDDDKDSDFHCPFERRALNQNDLDDLIRDLGLSKQASKFLASRLKERNLVTPDTNISVYRRREKNLVSFFSEANDFVFCNNISGLIAAMGLHNYDSKDWRLFIDLSKRSLKCVLLHNGNKLGSLPIAHSTRVKEEYPTISLVMEKIKYIEHNWVMCVDLKMVNFLLGQQS
jgi:hypothetical protein